MSISKVLAIDPGPKESAYVIWDNKEIHWAVILGNEFLLERLYQTDPKSIYLVQEEVQSYGMPVGKDVFETVYWTGVFAEAFRKGDLTAHFARLPRKAIKLHLCNSLRAKDSNIRQALIDRFGLPGTKKAPGLTYGLKKDLWQAFALAVTYHDLYFCDSA
ncbi:MAG TPA: hypothetical protein VMW42_13145 [Desulfatiglandales bacterium]|nr:hypothetical protein [Desulfatiglandales bacterium]